MALSSVEIKHFTAFSDLSVQFSSGLNVFIGENSTGKTHLLKLCYAIASVLHEARRFDEDTQNYKVKVNKSWYQRRIAEKLVGVFRPDSLGRLCRRGVGRSKSEVYMDFGHAKELRFSFSSNSQSEVSFDDLPGKGPRDAPIFFPPRELLSLYPGFAALYEQRELAIDETYYDLCKMLTAPLLRGKRAAEISQIVKPLEEIMGGVIRIESGRFYLQLPGQGNMEISLVAEGYRKIAMLAYLAANGSLTTKGMLLWDEPEANLNPRIIRKLCQSLIALVEGGTQVFVATHDLFLMKELSFLIEKSADRPHAQFFGLRLDDSEVKMEQGDLLEDIGTIVALDEVLRQDDEEQEFYVKGLQ